VRHASTPTLRRAGKHAAPMPALVEGTVIYGAILLVLAGIFDLFEGLAAIVDDDFFPANHHYIFSADAGWWGWVHVAVGVLVIAAGLNVVAGRTWARVAGIGVAALSAIDGFLFIPYQPFWSVLLIALDVAVIWALCRYEPAEPRGG
jgi:hypothetical protein